MLRCMIPTCCGARVVPICCCIAPMASPVSRGIPHYFFMTCSFHTHTHSNLFLILSTILSLTSKQLLKQGKN